MPQLILISIYYWCMFHPRALPYWFLFIIGIMQDTLSGMPLGFSSLVNMLFALIIVRKFRAFSRLSFASVWLRFMGLSLSVTLLSWFLAYLLKEGGASVQVQILRWLSTCLAYPLIHYVLTRIYDATHD